MAIVKESGVYRDEAAGIYLRPMTYDDTDLIVAWRNSDGVRKHFIYQGLFTRESHENWIRTMIDTGKVVQMMICLTENDKAVGSVYIRDIDRQHKAKDDCCKYAGIVVPVKLLMAHHRYNNIHYSGGDNCNCIKQQHPWAIQYRTAQKQRHNCNQHIFVVIFSFNISHK